MNETKPSYFWGRISFDRLFVGSKSEGLYPVLHVDIDSSYRLHVKGGVFGDESPLLPFNGKTVKVFGIADNTRGHWRIVLEDADTCVINEECSADSLETDEVIGEVIGEVNETHASKSDSEGLT